MRVAIICAVLLSGVSLLIAQDSSSTPDNSAPPAAAADSSNPVGSDADAGRILGVLPDNKIVPASDTSAEPLTVGGKFILAFKDTTDPSTLVLAGFYAGIAQWNNDYRQFGQGASGYGQRIGAAYADQAIGNYFSEAIIPSLTHEDPRYFRKSSGRKLRRMGYALTRTVITRDDRGRNVFNYSEFLGNGIAAGLSNFYYPSAQRTVGETTEKFAIQVVSDCAFNVLLEFWPDMRRLILKH